MGVSRLEATALHVGMGQHPNEHMGGRLLLAQAAPQEGPTSGRCPQISTRSPRTHLADTLVVKLAHSFS